VADIALFATDLDGTLLRSDSTISPRSAAAMQSAIAAGIEVVWATARVIHSVRDLAAQAGFTGIAVCANGALVHDLDSGRLVRTNAMDANAIETAMSIIRETVPGAVFALSGIDNFHAETGYAAIVQYADHNRAIEEINVAETLSEIGETAIKLIVRHPEMDPPTLFAALDKAVLGDVELTRSGAPFLELSATGISKAYALAQLCEERGIDRTQVAAAGDAHNDLAMLEWAGIALAPTNAEPEILELADQVIPSDDEDGVAVWLESLLDLQ
jgi:hypothetical protein